MEEISMMKAVDPLQMSHPWKKKTTSALPKPRIPLVLFQFLKRTTWNKWKITLAIRSIWKDLLIINIMRPKDRSGKAKVLNHWLPHINLDAIEMVAEIVN